MSHFFGHSCRGGRELDLTRVRFFFFFKLSVMERKRGKEDESVCKGICSVMDHGI